MAPSTARRIIGLRGELAGQDLDIGQVMIAWHLHREVLPVASTSTIRRILNTAGLITPSQGIGLARPTFGFKQHSPMKPGSQNSLIGAWQMEAKWVS